MRKESRQLLIVTTILICVGIVMVYSSSSCIAYENFHDSAAYLKRHLAHIIIALILAAPLFKTDYRKMKKYAGFLLVFAVFILLLVFLPGISNKTYGANRWIKIGFLSFQPSEIAGLALIFYTADVLERKQAHIRNFFYGFAPRIFAAGVIVSLILLQPDLGNSAALLFVVLIMMYVSGANMAHLAPFIVPALPVVYFLMFKVPYRLSRIMNYLDPWRDAQGGGFQIVQSFLALGGGGLFGVGLGCSRQKLFYLPQAHTDFIFSIIGEEVGIIGTLGVLFLFIVFIYLGTRIAIKARDLFGKFLGLGITVSIGLKAIINMAVSIGAIPTKGLPLPFISYGGTAIIVNIIAVALLLNIERNSLK
jgi:cell division protein FtsW